MPAIVNRRFRSEFGQNADGTISRMHATTCAHCNAIMVLAPGQTERVIVAGLDANGNPNGKREVIETPFCMKCMKPMCLACGVKMHRAGGVCDAFEKKLERKERLGEFYAKHYPEVDRDQAILINTGEVPEPPGRNSAVLGTW